MPMVEIIVPPAPAPTNVPAFLAKLWKMVENPDTGKKIKINFFNVQLCYFTKILHMYDFQMTTFAGQRTGAHSESGIRANSPAPYCPTTTSTPTWPPLSASSTCTASIKSLLYIPEISRYFVFMCVNPLTH